MDLQQVNNLSFYLATNPLLIFQRTAYIADGILTVDQTSFQPNHKTLAVNFYANTSFQIRKRMSHCHMTKSSTQAYYTNYKQLLRHLLLLALHKQNAHADPKAIYCGAISAST